MTDHVRPRGAPPAALSAVLSRDIDALVTAVSTPDVVEAEDAELTEMLRELESARNRLAVVEAALIRAAETRELPERHCHRRTAPWLSQLLRISPADAGRRVRAAQALTARPTMTGPLLPPARPMLAAARVSGEVSAEHTAIVLGAVETLERRLGDVELAATAEAELTRYATMFDPPGLRQLAGRLIEVYDPDGAEPDHEAAQRQRFFRMRQRTDSTWTGEFHLTPDVGAQLQTVLRSLSQDRSSVLGIEAEGGVERVALPDVRSHGQRVHDALGEACGSLLRAGGLPVSGGTPATVVVTVSAEQLRRKTGMARLADGATLPVSALPHLADQADVWSLLTSATGAPLNLGRSRRLATPGQTVALIARDGGCSFPGCEVPPQWCERHHIVEWSAGGRTDLSNLTLLCRYHHRHHLDHGWRVDIGASGLPEWIPPAWIDPLQRPRSNGRILLLRERVGGQEPSEVTGSTPGVTSAPDGHLGPSRLVSAGVPDDPGDSPRGAGDDAGVHPSGVPDELGVGMSGGPDELRVRPSGVSGDLGVGTSGGLDGLRVRPSGLSGDSGVRPAGLADDPSARPLVGLPPPVPVSGAADPQVDDWSPTEHWLDELEPSSGEELEEDDPLGDEEVAAFLHDFMARVGV